MIAVSWQAWVAVSVIAAIITYVIIATKDTRHPPTVIDDLSLDCAIGDHDACDQRRARDPTYACDCVCHGFLT